MNARGIVALLSGAVFGAGLALGGMTDPARVRGFLDLFGDWDPTLAFVMGGAVLVMVAVWHLLQPRLAHPLFADDFAIPTRKDLDARLLGGAALFGIGWGIAGLCPGPGIAALVIEPVGAAVFVAAMLAGMGLVRLTERKS
ncbi:DUF6691 family protein [Erythrobacter sp. HL-111]|uniref:DUF6691 family protein n=1 Tax=Erythrobacter sp. HL-111 TaxID=1798193 RepID=UPI0006DBA3E2|nr:DUF6691 family protein [Erythrobacter sp. HL-111]KPP92604.1 MAG: YedE/YeeE family transporter [Erythrobacteraceae bacterium HL-111]SDS94071.1 hypothetical protein SAMN04515621_2557 [Erythrobacter sp. HL-111]